MKKSKIIIECILLGLIVLVSTLLIIKPYVLALDKKVEKAPEVKKMSLRKKPVKERLC